MWLRNWRLLLKRRRVFPMHWSTCEQGWESILEHANCVKAVYSQLQKAFRQKWFLKPDIWWFLHGSTKANNNTFILLSLQTAKNYGWASGGSSILSEFGTLHMEFAYLSDITGEPLFKNLVERVRTVIQESSKPNTLYPNYLNPKTGKWGQQVIFNFYLFHENFVHYDFFFLSF